jgi:DNA invertase Pin-like site-specific DNA recombinase
MMGNPYPQGNYAEVHRSFRDSTTGQDKLRQDAILKPYEHIQGSEVNMDHYDHGYSGSDRKRPGLAQMRGFLRVPRPNGYRRLVMVADLSRLFRDLWGLLQFIEEHVCSGQCDLFIASPTPMTLRGTSIKDDVMTYQTITFLGMMAEIERMNIADRTRQALAAKKAKGQILGRPRDTSHDMQITDLHFQGKSAYAIHKELNISYKRVRNALDALCLNDDSGNNSDE